MSTLATRPACANCSRPCAPRACAPHKRFCSDACRMQWHGRRRAEALKAWELALAQAAAEEPPR